MVTQYKSPTPLWGSWWIWYPRRSRFLTICIRSSWPKCRTCLAMGDPAVGSQSLNFPGFPGAKMKRSKTHPGWFKGDVYYTQKIPEIEEYWSSNSLLCFFG
jgi:hypothetical protein